jgi:hypothetical protein
MVSVDSIDASKQNERVVFSVQLEDTEVVHHSFFHLVPTLIHSNSHSEHCFRPVK